MRMARLGAVEEELEELSLAENQEMEAEMELSLAENVSKETSEVRLGRKDQEENSEHKPQDCDNKPGMSLSLEKVCDNEQ